MIHLVTAPRNSPSINVCLLCGLETSTISFKVQIRPTSVLDLIHIIIFTSMVDWLCHRWNVIWCFFSESLVVTTRHRCFTGCSPFGICVGNWEEPLRKFSRSQMLQRLFVFWNFKCVRREYRWLTKSYIVTATIISNQAGKR